MAALQMMCFSFKDDTTNTLLLGTLNISMLISKGTLRLQKINLPLENKTAKLMFM